MRSRMIIATGLLATTMQLHAEQAPSAGLDPLKSQVLSFEDSLRRAVDVGGDAAGKQLASATGFQLSFEGSANVSGWPVPTYGFMFDINVPAVMGLQIYSIVVPRLAPRGPQPSSTSAQPVSNSSSVVAAGGTAPADPMTVSPVVAPLDARAAFRTNVKAAIIDTILDNSGVLPLGDSETLMVSYNGVDQSTAYRINSERVTLSILGADLNAFHQGKLSRDEAKQRIKEKTF